MIDAMDARTRRTIRKLENAFIDILETKNIDDVSVSEICSNAHVNRTTFYRYYRNQYGLSISKAEVVSQKISLSFSLIE